MEPVDVIKKLQATNSRLDKERILQETWDAGCVDFFTGAKLACDGLVTFGVKKVPEESLGNGINKTTAFNDFIELAGKLSKRELTGHDARDAILVFMANCDDNDWNNFYRLILLKDLKSGLSETTINKVLKKIGGKALDYMVTEFPYQRCCLPKHTDLTKFSWKDGVFSQIKSDGMFANINLYEDRSVYILSRSGKPFPLEQFNDLVLDVIDTFAANTQSHGELLVYRNGKELPREIGNGILNSVAQGGEFENGDKPIYVVWDQIPLECVKPKGKYDRAYSLRMSDLYWNIDNAQPENIKLVESKPVHSMEEAMQHYQEMLAKGKEGTIIKEPTAPWKDGTSKLQVKLKLDVECDLEIVGFNPGKGKNAELFGSIQCKTADGLLEVGVSGFKDDQRVDIWNKKEELLGTIMTVVSNSLMKPSGNNEKYSLFLPRFLEFRLDKSVADDLQKVKDQFESALQK